jgi:hypothetical protein
MNEVLTWIIINNDPAVQMPTMMAAPYSEFKVTIYLVYSQSKIKLLLIGFNTLLRLGESRAYVSYLPL